MDLILSIIGILVVVAIAFVIARFLLRLTGRVIGCILTAIVALGIAFILSILLHGHAFQYSVCHLPHQKFYSPNGIIIGWDHMIDGVWITIGIHQSHNWYIEQIRFMDSRDFTINIDDKNQVGNAFHVAHTGKTNLQAINLSLDKQGFFLG